MSHNFLNDSDEFPEYDNMEGIIKYSLKTRIINFKLFNSL